MCVCCLQQWFSNLPMKHNCLEFVRKTQITTMPHLSHLVTTAWDTNPGLQMSRVHLPHTVA